MSIRMNILYYLLILATFVSCEDWKTKVNEDCANLSNNTGMKIMPLGDSRVEGSRPGYESYRYELWKNLMEHNWEFDFIGTRREKAFYPDYEGICFDLDHEGTKGALTRDILQTVMDLPSEVTPDVVLLGIGINDLSNADVSVEEAIANINLIINHLKSRNNNIIIFLEKVPPLNISIANDYFDMIFNEFNDLILELGIEQTDGNSKVFIVDMLTDWSNDYLEDELHYNQTGAKYIGDKYFESMELNL